MVAIEIFIHRAELPSAIIIIIVFRLVEVVQTSELSQCRKLAQTLPALDPSVKHLVGVL